MGTIKGTGGRFLPGQSGNPAGRPLGSSHKRTVEFAETIAKHNFNAGEALLDLYNKAMWGFEHANREEKSQYLKIASALAINIADRIYPRLKAIEHTKTNPYEGMTPAQKIEIMKAAAKALEEQVGRGTGPSATRIIGDSSEDPK